MTLAFVLYNRICLLCIKKRSVYLSILYSYYVHWVFRKTSTRKFLVTLRNFSIEPRCGNKHWFEFGRIEVFFAFFRPFFQNLLRKKIEEWLKYKDKREKLYLTIGFGPATTGFRSQSSSNWATGPVVEQTKFSYVCDLCVGLGKRDLWKIL